MSGKKLQLPDHGLWEAVKETVTPISGGKRRKAHLAMATPVPPAMPRAEAAILVNKFRQSVPSLVPPALSNFDRRTTQKLGRGKLEPEARFDLHGLGLQDARFALLHFLSSCRMRGLRMVLVITGKGASQFAGHTLHGTKLVQTPEWQGKLKREVPLWLEEAQFRIHVVGIQPSHPRHGGGGALYVRLRKHENMLR